MSIFGQISAAIFGSPLQAQTLAAMPTPVDGAPVATDMPAATRVAAAAVPAASSAVTSTTVAAVTAPAATGATSPAVAKMATVDVAKVLDGIADAQDEELDWRKSIVDLMKLLKLDSSLKSRKALATELHYTGDLGDSASMNMWLHKQVMTKLAENGGIVPKDLKH